MNKINKNKNRSGKDLVLGKIIKSHFFVTIIFAAYTIVADSSRLFAPETILNRWKYLLGILLITTVVWLISNLFTINNIKINLLVGLLIITDIIVVSLIIYTERGMASSAVIFYSLPLLSAALTNKKPILTSTALFCISSYAYITIKYFVDYFNEGYKVQLYSSIGLHGSFILIMAYLLSVFIERERR